MPADGGFDRRAVIAGAAVLAGAATTAAVWARWKRSESSGHEFDPGLAGLLPSPADGRVFRMTVAEVDITPGHGVSMIGYGYKPRLSNGRCARRLRAQCAVLRDPDGTALTLVRVDAGALTYEVYRSIVDTLVADGTITTPANFMLNVSHTHSGPALGMHPDPRVLTHLPDAGLEGVRATAEDFKNKVIDLVRAAHKAEGVQVVLAHAVGQAEAGVVRWVNEQAGPTELPVLVARHAQSGKLEAVIYSYPCHPVCRGDDNVFDADFCGVASSLISAELKAPALFLQGTGGNVDPLGRGAGESRVHLVGQTLADAVVKTVREARFSRIKDGLDAAIDEVELPFAPDLANASVVAQLRRRYQERIINLAPGPTRAGAARRHAELMVKLIDTNRLPRGLEMTTQLWRLGGLRIAALAHEVVHPYTGFVRQLAGAGDLWVLGYTNYVECYLPTDAGLRSGGYAAGWNAESGRYFAGEAGSVMVYGWPAPLRSTLDAKPGSPGAEEIVLDRMRRLLRLV